MMDMPDKNLAANVVQLARAGERQSEDQLATAFVNAFEGRVLYNHSVGRYGCWMAWNEIKGVWQQDRALYVLGHIREFVRVNQTGPISANMVANVERLARTDDRVRTTAADYDRHPRLLATPGWYIDLETGHRFPPDPTLRITACTAAPLPGDAESHEPALFNKLLKAALSSDDKVEALWRIMAHTLSGERNVRGFPDFIICKGKSGSGKTTILAAFMEAMGDYAMVAECNLIARKDGKHPADKAAVQGKRMVLMDDPPKSMKLDVSRVKEMTSGTRYQGRFMSGNWEQMEAPLKLFLTCNYAPSVEDSEIEGLRRRTIVFPFNGSLPDEMLTDEFGTSLKAEYGRIIAKALRSVNALSNLKLTMPEEVEIETQKYLHELDLMGQFCLQHLRIATDRDEEDAPFLTSDAAYERYMQFMTGMGEKYGNKRGVTRSINDWLNANGIKAPFTDKRVGGGHRAKSGWIGLGLLP